MVVTSEGVFLHFAFRMVFFGVKNGPPAARLETLLRQACRPAEKLRHEATDAEDCLLFGGIIGDARDRDTMAATGIKKLGCRQRFIQPGISFDGDCGLPQPIEGRVRHAFLSLFMPFEQRGFSENLAHNPIEHLQDTAEAAFAVQVG